MVTLLKNVFAYYGCTVMHQLDMYVCNSEVKSIKIPSVGYRNILLLSTKGGEFYQTDSIPNLCGEEMGLTMFQTQHMLNM